MRLFVTGAAGYAGLHAAVALRRAGHQVTGLVRDAGSERARRLEREEVRVATGDLRKPETYREHLSESEAVIHTVLDFTDPQGTDRSLFEAFGEAARAAPRRRLFVYTTGCSIYGKRPERVLDEETPANPAHPLAFRMEMEKAFFAASVGDTRKIVLRPGFMYGADGHSSISGRWFEMGEEGRPVYRGDRGKGWSWIHIDDLAAAYVRVAESHPALDREIFCLADGQRPACVEVMRACVRSAGFTGELVFAPPSEEDISSTLFDQDEFIDSRKAARLLGWHPRHPGILDEVELYYASWKAARAERSARRPVEPRLDL